MLQIINYPPKFPKSVHLYITNACNLNCVKCHYRNPDDALIHLRFEQIKILFHEWKSYGLTSIAIGGGEPLLHPNIIEIVKLGKTLGFHMAVTTNGTKLLPINPHRVHISYDEIHPTWKKESLIRKAIIYYKGLGCKVGINHVVSNLDYIKYIDDTFPEIDNLLLIREKPISSFTDWELIPRKTKYWIEGCIEHSHCEQGILSFYLGPSLEASICSNIKQRIKYSTLNHTWKHLVKVKCPIRDAQTKVNCFSGN